MCLGVPAVRPGEETVPLPRPRYLFVVSRRHPQLLELLIERFQDDQNVEVILDRRVTTPEPALERRPDDRRQRRSRADDLNLRSHLIITRTD